MGILDDALNAPDPVRKRMDETLAQNKRDRQTLDNMAKEFAQVATKRGLPTQRLFGRGRLGDVGWAVGVDKWTDEAGQYLFVIYPDGRWSAASSILFRPIFGQAHRRLTVGKSQSTLIPDAALIKSSFTRAARDYAGR